ncbi:hypothetical protein MYX77_03100 [Acidobacteriia bacterium AH_259_A11_L15]|nr:hypothetical protein [Acidobacteriia bacterium AH_259_A11_L15]
MAEMKPMKTLNLRDLPEDFVRKVKSQAALEGLTLKDFIVRVVSTALPLEPPNQTAFFMAQAKKKRR